MPAGATLGSWNFLGCESGAEISPFVVGQACARRGLPRHLNPERMEKFRIESKLSYAAAILRGQKRQTIPVEPLTSFWVALSKWLWT